MPARRIALGCAPVISLVLVACGQDYSQSADQSNGDAQNNESAEVQPPPAPYVPTDAQKKAFKGLRADMALSKSACRMAKVLVDQALTQGDRFQAYNVAAEGAETCKNASMKLDNISFTEVGSEDVADKLHKAADSCGSAAFARGMVLQTMADVLNEGRPIQPKEAAESSERMASVKEDDAKCDKDVDMVAAQNGLEGKD